MTRILIALQAVDRWPRWLRLLAFLLFLVPVFPVLGRMAGWASLPLPGERDLKVLPQMVGAAAYLIVTLPIIMTDLEQRRSVSEAGRIFWGFALPAFLVFIAWQGATAGWLFLDALVRGRSVEVTYVIRDVTPGGNAKCPNSVRFVGLPPMWDGLCDVSPDVLRALRPGMAVALTGRGTGAWLIAAGPDLTPP
ncbi:MULTISPECIES: hypothetical protein [Paracoccus]|uniref:hypothetical protein n=1 Tax=Paracoccus TaxID=265 RepID=UPI00086CA381|nr:MULTISPECIES: hypothetical protein [Paracoccus]ODT61427.1 MAG: hypothetical protein ABS73_01890 [Paracoccus sp. SCN 68-21]